MTADTVSSSCEHCLIRFLSWPLPLSPEQKNKRRERGRGKKKKPGERSQRVPVHVHSLVGWRSGARWGTHPFNPELVASHPSPQSTPPLMKPARAGPPLLRVCVLCVCLSNRVRLPGDSMNPDVIPIAAGAEFGAKRVSPPLDEPAPPSLIHTSHFIYCL